MFSSDACKLTSPTKNPCNTRTLPKDVAAPRKNDLQCSRTAVRRNTDDTQYRGVWGANPWQVWTAVHYGKRSAAVRTTAHPKAVG
ncbi:MAG: hypothetical protein CL920_08950 [Deltaproteobacteria bacterium]|nr:hypothetical protein [Deltaproteobacteria bacterium]